MGSKYIQTLFEPGVRPESEEQNQGSPSIMFEPGKRPDGTDNISQLMSLNELLAISGLAGYLLKTNTFFYSRLGFHNHIIRKLSQITDLPQHHIKRIYTARNLPKNSNIRNAAGQINMLCPIVESDADLNKLATRLLSKGDPVWLVAHPGSIQKSLILGFHNFFITSSLKSELDFFQEIFKLPDNAFGSQSSETACQAVFATDFEKVINSLDCFPTATIRLTGLS